MGTGSREPALVLHGTVGRDVLDGYGVPGCAWVHAETLRVLEHDDAARAAGAAAVREARGLCLTSCLVRHRAGDAPAVHAGVLVATDILLHPPLVRCSIVPALVWMEALRVLDAGARTRTGASVSVDDVLLHPGLADPAARDAVLQMITCATLAGPILHALRTPSDVQWLQRVFAGAPIRDAPSAPGAPSEGTRYRVSRFLYCNGARGHDAGLVRYMLRSQERSNPVAIAGQADVWRRVWQHRDMVAALLGCPGQYLTALRTALDCML